MSTREPAVVEVRGPASAEEVAAVVSVVSALASRSAPVAEQPAPPSTWAAPERRVRRPLAAGPGGWRASGLPR